MHKDYIYMIEVINDILNDFNKFLDPKYFIPLFDLSKVNDNFYFTSLSNQPWDDLRFPNGDKRGVYFLLGSDPDNLTNKSMYIGKASFSSTIGRRLYCHLSKDRNNNGYFMNDNFGKTHILDYIFTIDLEACAPVMISSLEEFLIRNSRNKLYLLNGIGNN
jgi:hypothetical protein